MADLFERRTIAFVVRLWQEPMHRSGEPAWRGQIEHVGSHEAAHFEVPAGLVSFLAAHLIPPAVPERAGPASRGGDGSEEEKDG